MSINIKICNLSFLQIKFSNMEYISHRSDCPATNALLLNNIGKDLSAEMNNSQHRQAFDYISSHLRIGKFSTNDNEEKVSCKFRIFSSINK